MLASDGGRAGVGWFSLFFTVGDGANGCAMADILRWEGRLGVLASDGAMAHVLGWVGGPVMRACGIN